MKGVESTVHWASRVSELRGSLPNSLGCSLDPPPFASAIKCHQKSTSNSAGSSVGSLAPPRATPRLGGDVRVVPVLPLLLCTRPARARPSVGGQSPTPAPRQLPWSPPRGPERTVRLIGFSSSRQPVCHFEPWLQTRDRDEYCIAPAWCCCGRAARFTLEPRDAPWVM